MIHNGNQVIWRVRQGHRDVCWNCWDIACKNRRGKDMGQKEKWTQSNFGKELHFIAHHQLHSIFFMIFVLDFIKRERVNEIWLGNNVAMWESHWKLRLHFLSVVIVSEADCRHARCTFPAKDKECPIFFWPNCFGNLGHHVNYRNVLMHS